MVIISREEAIEKMNELGAKQIPFFFLTSFDTHQNIVLSLSDIDENELEFAFHKKTQKQNTRPIQLTKFPVQLKIYKQAFDFVQQQLHIGNSFLVNLTCQTPIEINLSLSEIYSIANAPYKVWWKDKFVCFSPETFVRINQEGFISSRPIKGTKKVMHPNAATELLADKKELYEHTTIVDLIRNDISRVAQKVWVEQFRYLDCITTDTGEQLLQVCSDIRGLLPQNWYEQLGNLVFELLPAGSITGAPKDKTVWIIQQAENYERNFYTGIMGLFTGTTLDTSVLIRFIEQTSDGLVFKSGGGITTNSGLVAEYQEMIDKIYVPTTF